MLPPPARIPFACFFVGVGDGSATGGVLPLALRPGHSTPSSGSGASGALGSSSAASGGCGGGGGFWAFAVTGTGGAVAAAQSSRAAPSLEPRPIIRNESNQRS